MLPSGYNLLPESGIPSPEQQCTMTIACPDEERVLSINFETCWFFGIGKCNRQKLCGWRDQLWKAHVAGIHKMRRCRLHELVIFNPIMTTSKITGSCWFMVNLSLAEGRRLCPHSSCFYAVCQDEKWNIQNISKIGYSSIMVSQEDESQRREVGAVPLVTVNFLPHADIFLASRR